MPTDRATSISSGRPSRVARGPRARISNNGQRFPRRPRGTRLLDGPSLGAPRAGLTERLSRLRDRNRGACASTPSTRARRRERARVDSNLREAARRARVLLRRRRPPRANARRVRGDGRAPRRAQGAPLAVPPRVRTTRRRLPDRARARPRPLRDHAHASTSNLGDVAASAASAAERRLAAVAISNEWRDPTHRNPPRTSRIRVRRLPSTATSNGFALRSADADAGGAAPRDRLRRVLRHPRGVFASSASRPRSGRPTIPAEPTPVVVVTARGPPGALVRDLVVVPRRSRGVDHRATEDHHLAFVSSGRARRSIPSGEFHRARRSRRR